MGDRTAELVMADLPAGAVLAHTQWGEPKNDTSVMVGDVELANGGVPWEGASTVLAERAPEPQPNLPPPSGDPVTGDEPWWPQDEDPPQTPLDLDRTKRCRAKDDTCRGWRIKGSDFCAAHAGILKGGDHERTGRAKSKRARQYAAARARKKAAESP